MPRHRAGTVATFDHRPDRGLGTILRVMPDLDALVALMPFAGHLGLTLDEAGPERGGRGRDR